MDAFRAEMPVSNRWAYFDHAAVAPTSGPARTAIEGWLRDSTENGDANYPGWMACIARLRSLTARLINADTSEIALLGNTTAGINLVAEGFPWQAGDNVVTRADEFPSNQYPWLNLSHRGVEVRRLPVEPDGSLDLNRLADACDARTRIVTLSWVAYSNGWRHDLDQVAQLVHDRGALLFVDAIQGLGVFPLDVQQTPIDFLAADGHKWLLGPEGAALFYCRREHLDLLRPLGVGWNSVVNEHDFGRIELVLKSTAERYEGGSSNCAGLIGLGASLELLASFGFEAIAARVLEITDLACQRLAAAGARIITNRQGEHRSGIVTFALPGADHQQVRQRCLDRGIVLSCRGGGLRVSPHAYNNEADLDRLLEVISAA
ncbi:MAG: aminotransferase class V-fold PLP-dependent enzyme [Patescibacteria group bacterium]|nr:aminotransferase class V-fold PLP-dependent enzyme [Patescibacteria group bacterium]